MKGDDEDANANHELPCKENDDGPEQGPPTIPRSFCNFWQRGRGDDRSWGLVGIFCHRWLEGVGWPVVAEEQILICKASFEKRLAFLRRVGKGLACFE